MSATLPEPDVTAAGFGKNASGTMAMSYDAAPLVDRDSTLHKWMADPVGQTNDVAVQEQKRLPLVHSVVSPS